MNYKSKYLLLPILISTSIPVFAGATTQSTQSRTDITASRQTQSDEKHLQWGLTQEEYARYEELIKGIRGSLSPETISPIEVLGIHSESDAERNKYARMWADMMEQDAERILAFQRAYDRAWQEKGGVQLIDISKLKLETANSTQTSEAPSANNNTNRILLVTRLDGCPQCDKEIQQLLTAMIVDWSMQIDVYFSDSDGKENSVIRQWAMKNKVNADLLRSRRITLNHGKTLMHQYQLEETKLPVKFKVGNNGGVKRVE